jgi:hypothetical protein
MRVNVGQHVSDAHFLFLLEVRLLKKYILCGLTRRVSAATLSPDGSCLGLITAYHKKTEI